MLVDGRPRKASFRLQPGMRVIVEPISERPAHSLTPVDMPLVVPYEDEHLLVVDKPAGLSVHPSPTANEPTLVHALLARSHSLSSAAGAYRPGIVHRLDKDTSGLLLVAKSDAVHHALQKAIQEKTVRRVYRAVVRGVAASKAFIIRSSLGRNPSNRQKQAVVDSSAPDARIAITHCRSIRTFAPSVYDVASSEIECELETGRTHQIRVHLASAGLPILGDSLYGVASKHFKTQALHAYILELVHPVTRESMLLKSDPPWGSA